MDFFYFPLLRWQFETNIHIWFLCTYASNKQAFVQQGDMWYLSHDHLNLRYFKYLILVLFSVKYQILGVKQK